jgi:hypothetical protein
MPVANSYANAIAFPVGASCRSRSTSFDWVAVPLIFLFREQCSRNYTLALFQKKCSKSAFSRGKRKYRTFPAIAGLRLFRRCSAFRGAHSRDRVSRLLSKKICNVTSMRLPNVTLQLRALRSFGSARFYVCVSRFEVAVLNFSCALTLFPRHLLGQYP